MLTAFHYLGESYASGLGTGQVTKKSGIKFDVFCKNIASWPYNYAARPAPSKGSSLSVTAAFARKQEAAEGHASKNTAASVKTIMASFRGGLSPRRVLVVGKSRRIAAFGTQGFRG